MLARLLDPDHAFFNLSHQYQRDLLWSILGPSLLDCDWAPETPKWLAAYSTDQLLQSISSVRNPNTFRSPRLGLMFEQLWHRFFELNDLRYQANIQIRDEQKTLGELDLLFTASNDDPAITTAQNHHIELALKFYLGFGEDWIGPNRRDYLAEKIRHTHDHQLPLSEHPVALARLTENHWRDMYSQAVMRGCLFYPAADNIRTYLPAEVADQHWRGQWCWFKDSKEYLPHSRWYILSKPQWISPAQTEFSVSRERLLEHINIHFKYLVSAVCAVEVVQNQQGKWCEQQRWLIMPDHWPNIPA